MSITESGGPESYDGSGAERPAAGPGPGERRAYRIWRVAVAAGEATVAALLVVAALRAWAQAVVPIALPGLPASTHAVSRLLGSWVALAVLAVTVAGLLVLDALRRLVIARRAARLRKTGRMGPVVPGEA